MLHHNVFTNGGPDYQRDDGACPHRSVTERFYGTGEELLPLTLPRCYGYPTAPADRWKMIWMVMNHRQGQGCAIPFRGLGGNTSPVLMSQVVRVR